MQIGLVGMPYSGKSTLFQLLTGNKEGGSAGNNGEVLLGSAIVPDKRIDFLSSFYKPKKTTYARISFKDIPGVRMDDGKNRAARLLDEVRSADALVQVIRAFDNDGVNQIAGEPDPFLELTSYGEDLLLADIDVLEKRIERIENATKPKKEDQEQLELLHKLLKALEEEQLISSLDLTDRERDLLAGQSFLTEKPLFVAINIDENQLQAGCYPQKEKIEAYVVEKGISIIEICAPAEIEIGRLDPGDQAEFIEDLGLKESGLGRLSRMVYDQLNLMSFFTVGEDEVRAWTINKGSYTCQAAGKIHSDIARGFIRAEVFHFDNLKEAGSVAEVRKHGQFRLEGKDYCVEDGDIISFRFNV